MRSARWAAVILLAGTVACTQKPETAEQMTARMAAESDSAMAIIRTNDAEFARLYSAGQFDSVVAFYAEDGQVMPPNGKAAMGRPAIRAAMSEGSGQGTSKLSLTPVTVTANGPLAVEVGTYASQWTPNASAKAPMNVARSDTGKYVVHWQRKDGQWQIVDDIFNSDRPLPAPPAAKPARPATHRPAAARGTRRTAPAKRTGHA